MIWHTREESGLRLDRELTWWHDGERIEHPNIIEAFNRGLTVADDGRYQLHFGGDWCFVAVEDCGYAVIAVDEAAGHRLSIRLSDRTAEWLDPLTLAADDDGALTVKVKGGKAKARFTREAHFELGTLLRADGDQVVIDVHGTCWPTRLGPDTLALSE